MLKFRSRPIAEHDEVPLADDGAFEDIIDRFDAITPGRDPARRASYVVSVGAERDARVRTAQLSEILALVRSQDDCIVGQEVCHLSNPNPRTLLGKGMAQDIASRARQSGATMLVLDAELSPSQTRNLEDLAGIPICDREAVILNVFLRHARTRRARVQVEVARLAFLRPRIRGVGLDMDQQMGGTRYARGPGETASELMARKIDTRLEKLKKVLRKLDRSIETQRQKRLHNSKRVVLVGYTNAGKTSLMNALTAADLAARDMPFETLDTTSRCLRRYGGEVLLSDTVGFIRRLPGRLLASFESTLSEIRDASLLLVVVDVSDDERALHLRTTIDLIEKIGAKDVPRFFVFNKIDRLETNGSRALQELAEWSDGHPWIALSSHDAIAVRGLEERILQSVERDDEELATFVPYSAADVLALVYGKCRVLESSAAPGGVRFRIRGTLPILRRIRDEARAARHDERTEHEEMHR